MTFHQRQIIILDIRRLKHMVVSRRAILTCLSLTLPGRLASARRLSPTRSSQRRLNGALNMRKKTAAVPFADADRRPLRRLWHHNV